MPSRDLVSISIAQTAEQGPPGEFPAQPRHSNNTNNNDGDGESSAVSLTSPLGSLSDWQRSQSLEAFSGRAASGGGGSGSGAGAGGVGGGGDDGESPRFGGNMETTEAFLNSPASTRSKPASNAPWGSGRSVAGLGDGISSGHWSMSDPHAVRTSSFKAKRVSTQRAGIVPPGASSSTVDDPYGSQSSWKNQVAVNDDDDDGDEAQGGTAGAARERSSSAASTLSSEGNTTAARHWQAEPGDPVLAMLQDTAARPLISSRTHWGSHSAAAAAGSATAEPVTALRQREDSDFSAHSNLSPTAAAAAAAASASLASPGGLRRSPMPGGPDSVSSKRSARDSLASVKLPPITPAGSTTKFGEF